MNLGATGPCPEFVQALSVCLQEYLVRVRNQMTEWFTNILNREQEVVSGCLPSCVCVAYVCHERGA